MAMSAALPDLSAKVVKEMLSLSDGTTLQLAKTAGVSDNEWEETKKWLESNPEEARRWENYAKDASAVRAHLQTNVFQDFYQTKISYQDEQVCAKIRSLERNPEFAHIFEEIKRGGVQAAMHHYYNEPLMMKMSRMVGGVPEETRDYLERVQKTPITFQEACKWGDLKTVQDYLNANGASAVDDKDAKGVTGLGYAIGANRGAVAKLLIESGANPVSVDTSGCSGLHYAAAYGRKEMLDYLISAGGDVNGKNTQGQTPLALATKNKQAVTVDLLKSKGATM
mmetsp:Transcript_145513/g.466341  ORF Transcript_145513/g.466341 Transcript_145513/m.466341 type:complete len:281 (+) Transcript_145513:41-883(+)